MKKLTRFSSQLEAHLVTQAIQALGIKAEMRGFKEYTSIVLGSDLGSFDVYVDSRYYDEAMFYLQAREAEAEKAAALSPVPLPAARASLHKAIIYSIFSVLLVPVVFNVIAWVHLNYYLRSEKNFNRKLTTVMIVILIQIPGAYSLYFLLRWIFA